MFFSRKLSCALAVLLSILSSLKPINLQFMETAACAALLPTGLAAECKKTITSKKVHQAYYELAHDANELAVLLLNWYNSYCNQKLNENFHHGDIVFYTSGIGYCFYNVSKSIGKIFTLLDKQFLKSPCSEENTTKKIARIALLAAECVSSFLNAKEATSPHAKLAYKNIFLHSLLLKRALYDDVQQKELIALAVAVLSNTVNALIAYNKLEIAVPNYPIFRELRRTRRGRNDAFQAIDPTTGRPYGPTITIVQGDITQQQFRNPNAAAIVNAANSAMRGGGGIDRAVHNAAGPLLLNFEQANNLSCPTGQARITPAFNLAANNVCSHIIHAVGPIGQQPALLRDAYLNSLRQAELHNLEYIALPAISTGIFGYPLQQATEVALGAITTYIHDNPRTSLREIRLVSFDDHIFNTYNRVAQQFLHP